MVCAGGLLKTEDNDLKEITNVPEVLKRDYETGDFSELFPFLTDGCEFNIRTGVFSAAEKR